MGITALSFVRSNRLEHYSLMQYGAFAGRLILQAVDNRRCNQRAIFFHDVYMSHVTILPGCLARTLGNASQADWPFAYTTVCPKQTILMALNN